nr:hypothetical protein [Tanacetum cinerariifolium]
MIGNKAYFVEYQDFNGGPVAFRGSKGQITGKGKIRTRKLDFEDVYFVKELQHFNLFSVSQMCDKKNKAKAVSTACYVLNRVLVTKPQNKTHYELITGKIPIISYIRPFRCHATILNTIDHLGKFEEKSDEGFLVGYSLNSKAFMVYNLETKRVEENLHINFLENKHNVVGKGPTWLIDLNYLTDSMNSQPVTTENKANKTASLKEANNSACIQDNVDAGNSDMEAEHVQEYFVLPLWSSCTSTVKSSKAKNGDQKLNGDTISKINKELVDQDDQAFFKELKRIKRQAKEADDATKTLRKIFTQGTEDLLLQAGATRASITNYVNTANTPVNTASTPVNTASPSKNVSAAGPYYPDLLTYANQDDSQIPSLEDIYEVLNYGILTSASYDAEGAVADFISLESTMNEDLLQFKTQQVWILVDLPFRKKGHRQEEEIDYDEVFAPVARIEAIKIFLAFSSYIGFIVYQMDVKSAFLYGKINEKVYVSQPSGFIDPKFPKKVYKVVKALYGLHQAPKAWYATLSTFLVKRREDRIFISQDKYVAEILKKFDFMSEKTASTPIETKKPLVKDAEAADVDVHLYRSMIGSLMYLTAFRPDIMYAVCACFRFQEIHNKRLSISWHETYFMAVKKANNYGYIYYRGRMGCGCFDDYLMFFGMRIKGYIWGRKAKTGLNIKESNFNKLDDLVGEGDNYAVNKGRSTDKIKVLNTEAEGVSVAGETLSTATLAVSTASVQPRKARSKMKRMSKKQKTDADLEEEEHLRVFLNIIPDEEREVIM